MLQVAKEATYLTKDGKPFFYLGDTCWSAFTNISDGEWAYYLNKRKAQGFNVLQINILPQWDASQTELNYE
ncbi:apiosidase-like domain-containing protein, partial [Dubosiella newyorkensis]